MSKQTAVEWLNQQIVDRQNGNGNSKSWDEILEQAKAMEKEQIIEAHDEGEGKVVGNGLKYYNKTYGK
jgi:hypothetical protein